MSHTVSKWRGLSYEPVRGLADRLVARWLRSQRKNIRRTFWERGHVDLAQQLEQLKQNPRQAALEKNRRFQEIMNEYIARVSSQAAPVSEGRSVDVLPAESSDAALLHRARPDTEGSVPAVADEARDSGSEPVIEE